VANTADPLGGSFFVERLTKDMEDGAFEYFRKLDAMGGMVKAIEHGFPQKEIAEASYAYQRAVEKKEKIIVGVNDYVIDETPQEILYIGEEARDQQTAKLKHLRAQRSQDAVDRALEALRGAAAEEPATRPGQLSSANTMPFILDCVRAYATVGEICAALRDVMGTYTEVSIA
jgi:methylmalonyl-CoA mutase N-terminal domain/subunit